MENFIRIKEIIITKYISGDKLNDHYGSFYIKGKNGTEHIYGTEHLSLIIGNEMKKHINDYDQITVSLKKLDYNPFKIFPRNIP